MTCRTSGLESVVTNGRPASREQAEPLRRRRRERVATGRAGTTDFLFRAQDPPRVRAFAGVRAAELEQALGGAVEVAIVIGLGRELAQVQRRTSDAARPREEVHAAQHE